MAATLGLRGTGSFSSDERPKNWREALLYLFPNGEAPLTALLSMLKSQPTDDAEFNWWEKTLPTQRLTVNGAHASGATAITVDSGAKDCVIGTVLMHEEGDNEVIIVTADPTSDTSLGTVSRSWGAVAAETLADDDHLVVIGNVHEEGASIPTAKAYAPTKRFNYTQIFRMPLSLTRTARKTRLRWDNTGPYREARREALSLHSIEMEKSFIWGDRVEDTSGSHPKRMTGGILYFMSTNKGGKFNVAGLLDEATLDDLMEDIFRYGSNEKLALCGSTFLRTITSLGKRNGTLNLVPQDRTYGMKVVEYLTAFGTLMLKNHPLMSQHPVWRKDAIILDVDKLNYRYIDDTMFVRNRQSPGDDLSKDEFLTEGGLELHFEEAHGHIQGVTGALIT